MSLAAAELERQGITTVVLQFLHVIATKVGPPRALLVPFPHGYALGKPGDAAGHLKVISAALEILSKPKVEVPYLETYSNG